MRIVLKMLRIEERLNSKMVTKAETSFSQRNPTGPFYWEDTSGTSDQNSHYTIVG
jgi:hypothetical protein